MQVEVVFIYTTESEKFIGQLPFQKRITRVFTSDLHPVIYSVIG